MNTIEFSKQIRIESLKMVSRAKSSHIASAFSCADILAVLYNDIMKFNSKDPNFVDRDRFILSKGHAGVALYAALALKNFFSKGELKKYGKKNSNLMAHISHKVRGVEFSTGSLGQGLPFATGKAYFAKMNKKRWRTFVLLSDGELNEGSNWEAIFFIGHHCLSNMTIIIDNNKLQGMSKTKNIMNIENFIKNISHLNFDIKHIDGHNFKEIKKALSYKSKKPKFIIANTIKGKGIDFMENNNLWHYKNPDWRDLDLLISKINNN